MKKIAGVAGIVLVAALAYLFFWPVPIEPVAWAAADAAGLYRRVRPQHPSFRAAS